MSGVNVFHHLVPLTWVLAATRWKTFCGGWRICCSPPPPTVDYLFLHCGTNNLHSSSHKDIADGILAIGIMAKRKRAGLKVIVGGLLHSDQEIAEINKVLRQKIRKLKDFYYMEEDCDWLIDDDSLSMDVFYQDLMKSLVIPLLGNSSTSSHCHLHLLLASF